MSTPTARRAPGFYDPRTYDWAIGNSRRRAERHHFYLEQAGRMGAVVLELGCGTGDLCLALASRGVHVVGLDSSPDMIRAARRKARRQSATRVAWVQARMETFAFRTAFTAVIAPYHTLCHVLRPAELDTLLRRVHDHLTPGGVFLADIPTRPIGESPRRRSRTRTPTPDGIYQVDEDERYDPLTGRLHTSFAYRLEHPVTGEILNAWTRHLDYLLTGPDDLARRLRADGFTAVDHFAAFDPAAPPVPGDDVVMRATRGPGR